MYFVIPILIAVAVGLYLLASGAATYALLAIMVVPIIYLAVRRPTLLCAMTVASQAWQILAVGSLTIFKFLMLLLLLQMLVLRKRSDRWHTPPPRYSTIAVALLIWMCLCELFVTQPNFEFLMELFGCVVMYLSTVQLIRTEHDFRVLVLVTMLNMLLIGLWVTFEVPWTAMTRGVVRAAGPVGQPNSLGEFVVLSTPLTVVFILDRAVPAWQRWTAVASAGLGVYALFASASRSAFVGYIVGMAAVLLGLVVFTRMSRLLATGMVVAIVAVFAFAPKSFAQRVFGTAQTMANEGEISPQRQSRNEMTSDRDRHAAFGLQMIAERPVVGWGFDGFGQRWQRTEGGYAAPHSAFIGVGVAYGVPALALYTLLLLWPLWFGLRTIRQLPTGRNYPIALLATSMGIISYMAVSPNLLRFRDWCPHLLLVVLWHHRHRWLDLTSTSPTAPAATSAYPIGHQTRIG